MSGNHDAEIIQRSLTEPVVPRLIWRKGTYMIQFPGCSYWQWLDPGDGITDDEFPPDAVEFTITL